MRMAVYEYRATTRAGKAARGVIDADSPAAARRKLREQDLFPTQVAETSDGSGLNALPLSDTAATLAAPKAMLSWGRVSVRDTALMTRQFAVLLQAGMPLVDALSALLDQTIKPRLRKAIYDVRDQVKSGSSLADALSRHPRVFSQLYSNMVRAGEAGARSNRCWSGWRTSRNIKPDCAPA